MLLPLSWISRGLPIARGGAAVPLAPVGELAAKRGEHIVVAVEKSGAGVA